MICQDSASIATSTTTTEMRLPTTPDRVEVKACCAPITSLLSRETRAPVWARVKKAMGWRCTWSYTWVRRSKMSPSPMRADRYQRDQADGGEQHRQQRDEQRGLDHHGAVAHGDPVVDDAPEQQRLGHR